ncbi:glutamate-5-semialdehyde dehydrogenase [Echinicola shivajiensis]|uniref:glutamate-5-semialdehyde dehydrogenase n=1 Tax=Echinicola shivajiensis TaxID=1035916 RepID=UPI001BFC057F|nr:glutamate-5-semialdehyde dehydrogenase [Echinicola shivajiensis]
MNLNDTFSKVNKASRSLALLSEDRINKTLDDLAQLTWENIPEILAANEKDLQRMDPEDPKYDRLKLTKARIEAIAADILNVVKLPSPLNRTLSEKSLENGLKLTKVSVPLGVIGIIYEARPNVTFDVFSLCLKSGNALVLKGGSDAHDSNTAIVKLIHQVLKENGIDPNIVALLPPDREATAEMLQAVDYIDIIIPRGSQGLINFVRNNSKVPVIETGAGIVHTYLDKSGDIEKAAKIITNAKTRRVSVCNALDCLVIHQDKLEELPKIARSLGEKQVKVFADKAAYEVLKESYPKALLFEAEDKHFGTEFLAMTMSIKTVPSLESALEHIAKHSSKHSEAIVAEDQAALDIFLKSVDAAAVYANTSTAFTDGAQFGLGAEIGISTQKLHARGPMALEELTSYKWIIRGDGHIRD